MPEILLHYIWQKMLFASRPQFTQSGKPVEIISAGRHNLESGPDFTDVHLRIGDREWVGNVEIHVASSDWYRHRHHLDPAYDNIILHVVRKADKITYNSRMEAVETLALDYDLDRDYLSSLLRDAFSMDSAFANHPCGKRLLRDPELLSYGWRQALLHQRLDCKRTQILKILDIVGGSWEDAFYITLSRNFGFHTNSLPFEQLAINTPLRYLQKHSNSLFQLTAMLLGQSGLLDPNFHPGSDSPRMHTAEEAALWREYQFLQHKFSLIPLEGKVWKRGRIRPTNAPELRIRQFAQLIYQSQYLFSRLMDAQSLDDMRALFALRTLSADEADGVHAPMAIGADSIDVILINTVIPYRYTYGMSKGLPASVVEPPSMAEPTLFESPVVVESSVVSELSPLSRAVSELSSISAENNAIIRQWRELGQSVHDASDTQALIHLYTNYCQPHNCMSCDVGYQIFLQS